jgi:hypothetical protein
MRKTKSSSPSLSSSWPMSLSSSCEQLTTRNPFHSSINKLSRLRSVNVIVEGSVVLRVYEALYSRVVIVVGHSYILILVVTILRCIVVSIGLILLGKREARSRQTEA